MPRAASVAALGFLSMALLGCPSGDPEPPKASPPKAVPNPSGANPVSAGNRAKLKLSMMAALSAAKTYKATTGKAPADMRALLKEELLTTQQAKDPWGNAWIIDTSQPSIKVITYGADGAPGGTDANTDWSSDDL